MNPNQQVPDFLFQVAQGFYDVGLNAASDPFKDPNEGLRRIVTGAVNLSFAAELLMKGLLLVTDNKTAKGHELNKLFKLLRPDIQKQIEFRYNHYQIEDKDDKSLGSFAMSVTKKKEDKMIIPSQKDLHSFLIAHNKTFESWRYVYEIGEEGFQYEVDFKSFHCFIKGLIETLNSIEWKGRFHKVK